MKQTVIIDFDGVLHSYKSGWKGAAVIPDPPTEGAREAIAEIRKTYVAIVVSSRCHQPGGIEAIREWLALHGIEVDDVTNDKPPHIVTIDDRALRFEGDWADTISRIADAGVPWNKQSNTP